MNLNMNFYLFSLVLSIFITGFCNEQVSIRKNPDTSTLEQKLNDLGLFKNKLSTLFSGRNKEESHPFCKDEQNELRTNMCQITNNLWRGENTNSANVYANQCEYITVKLGKKSCTIKAVKCYSCADKVSYFALIDSYGTSGSFYRVEPIFRSQSYSVTGQIVNYEHLTIRPSNRGSSSRSAHTPTADFETEYEIPTVNFGND